MQTIDYYPYGDIRQNTKATSFDTQRKYIGELYDDTAQLSYLNARYYNPSTGQFVSQDPVAQTLGINNISQQLLLDPQQQNLYSYAKNNPIKYTDPNGTCAGPALIPCLFIIGAGVNSYATYTGDVINNRANGRENAFTDNLSSPMSYVAGDVIGGTTMAFLGSYKVATAVSSAFGSAAQDALNGEYPDIKKAALSGSATYVTGGFFSWGVGKVPASKKVLEKMTGEIFGSSTSVVTQNILSSPGNTHQQQQIQNPYTQLWTLPNGAVSTWSGVIVVPPPSKNK
ncbi:MAG: RHS repeat-associated core domain-containing protein [Minisyncoccia bacterium]